MSKRPDQDVSVEPVLPAGLRNEQIWLVVGSLMILAAIALAGALYYTRDVLVPFVLAIFITTAVAPVVDVLVLKLRFPGWLAILIALLIVLAILTLLGSILLVVVQEMLRMATEYSRQVADMAERVLEDLETHRVHIDQARITTELEARLPGLITSAAGTATSVFSSGFLILIFVIFLLAGRNPRAVRRGIYADIERTIRGYITTKTLISAATGILVGLILWLLGLRMAFLFGLLAFLLNYIPSIGSIIATFLPLPIAVTQFESPLWIMLVVGLPGTVHMTIGNIIEPKMMGRGLELHPVTVILALSFLGLLWGVVGMVLAVPIVASLRIVLGRFPTTKPLGDLLAGRLPGTPAPA